MTSSPIAIPYAKALFDHAKELNLLEVALKDMKTVAELCQNSKEFRQLLKSPIVTIEKKQTIFQRVFADNLSQLSFTFFKIIINKKREAIIQDIALEFIELYKEHKGILTVNLKTAVPATDTIRTQVKDVMKQHHKGEIELIEEVKAELIGGFVLQWNNQQFDASITSQINRMQKGVARINLYVKDF